MYGGLFDFFIGFFMAIISKIAKQLELFKGAQYLGKEWEEMIPLLFHGTKNPIGNLDLRSGRYMRNLVGSGLYATDTRHVAETYAREKGDDVVKNLYRVHTPKYMRVFNAEGPFSLDHPIARRFDEFMQQETKRVGPELTSEYRYAMQELRDQKEGFGFTDWVKSLYNNVGYHTNHMIQDAAAQAGYDAIRYQGGIRVGGEGLHNAYSFVRPDKVKLEPLIGGVKQVKSVPRSFGQQAEQLALNVDQMSLNFGPQRHVPVRDLAPSRKHSTARTGRMPTLSSSLRRLQDLGEQLDIYSMVPFGTYVGRPRM